MTIRVGQIPYLNSIPFYSDLSCPEFELVSLVPRVMGECAREGQLDAGLLSLVDCLKLWDEFEPVGGMGLSIKGRVGSVALYSRVPMAELHGKVIGITTETATSVNLLRILLEKKEKVVPLEYSALDTVDTCDAFLLIGDQALQKPEAGMAFPYYFDLAWEWLQWKNLPFVFALWMVRRYVDTLYKAKLAEKLEKSLKMNIGEQFESIKNEATSDTMSADDVVQYLGRFRYLLEPEDWAAVNAFQQAYQTLEIKEELVK